MSPKEAITELRRYFSPAWNIQVTCATGEYSNDEYEGGGAKPYVHWRVSAWLSSDRESHRSSTHGAETLEHAVAQVTAGRILLPIAVSAEAEAFFAGAQQRECGCTDRT